ncbi:hypothetical protein SADUNF_Sadunf14G0066000 [Salix dunnii]|uniref:Uncharacterized protein n=1 Tax=Salix dunnii TaxID=1413687 RepID=A0A835MKF6_9ROSI|nr:hypothetical protein SADUNF_Sadunf14G0066000 [Salix dunnii]
MGCMFSKLRHPCSKLRFIFDCLRAHGQFAPVETRFCQVGNLALMTVILTGYQMLKTTLTTSALIINNP